MPWRLLAPAKGSGDSLEEWSQAGGAGEFSKRAFLNGRIDLAQAEGIMEVINARTNKGLDLALSHLEGKLSRKIEEIKDEIIGLYAHLEAAIDYAEEDVEDLDHVELENNLKEIKGSWRNSWLPVNRARFTPGKALRLSLWVNPM